MAEQTANYNLIKPLDNETADISVINQNMDAIDTALSPAADPLSVPEGNGPGKLNLWVSWLANRIVAITGGTHWWDAPAATLAGLNSSLNSHQADYTLQVPYGGSTTNVGNDYSIAAPEITALAPGLAVCFKVNADSTGAVTLNWCNLGAKPVSKANGSAVTNWKTNGVYTLRYDGLNFIVQGEGASGNAAASDLLSGKTASTDAGDITGIMPNRGAVVITPGTANQVITDGYHNGSGYVVGDAYLVPENIKSGVNIFGVGGSYIAAKVKSIQRGTVADVSSVTINAVDMSKSIVLYSPYAKASESNMELIVSAARLTASTTLTITGGHKTGKWEVIEFESGIKSIQTGVSNVFGLNKYTATATINAIDVSKSFLIPQYYVSSGTGYDSYSLCGQEILDSTTLQFTRGHANSDMVYPVMAWQVIEFE